MPKPTGKEIADALLAARDLMNDKGAHWIKGTLRKTVRRKTDGEWTKETSFCSIGAINEITKGNPALRKATVAALAGTVPKTPWAPTEPKSRIINWNDSGARKWGEISRAFRRAARQALKS